MYFSIDLKWKAGCIVGASYLQLPQLGEMKPPQLMDVELGGLLYDYAGLLLHLLHSPKHCQAKSLFCC